MDKQFIIALPDGVARDKDGFITKVTVTRMEGRRSYSDQDIIIPISHKTKDVNAVYEIVLDCLKALKIAE